jgi:predicted alternative tryptophan synthase beta-subunit
LPLIWQVDRLKWMRAMSRMEGWVPQPESEMCSRTSTGAPQWGQVRSTLSLGVRQYGQV